MHAGYAYSWSTCPPHKLGERGGAETVTLLDSEMPSHSHGLQAQSASANLDVGAPDRSLASSEGGFAYKQSPFTNLVSMSPAILARTGGGQPHNNIQPYLTLNFCIALESVYPARS